MMKKSEESPRQRRHRAKLQQILGAARDMVIKGGFGSLSMHRLARAVDFTPGALYRYFASKDALMAALLVQIIESFADVMARVASLVPETDSLARIVALTRAYRGLAKTRPHRFGLLALILAEPRHLIDSNELAASTTGAMYGAMAPLAQALGRAAATAALDYAPLRPEQASVLVFAATHGVLQLHKQARWLPELIDIEALSRTTVRTLLLGWGAVEAAVASAFATVDGLGDLVNQAGGLE